MQFAVFTCLSKEVALFHECAIAPSLKCFPEYLEPDCATARPQLGHSWEAWETCSKVLPRVSWLINLSKKHKIKPSDPWPFSELIFRTGTWGGKHPEVPEGADTGSGISGSVNSPLYPGLSLITASLLVLTALVWLAIKLSDS